MLRQGFVFAAALWLALPVTASAQAGAAVIAGTVRDTSGGAVPGATVRIVNQQTRGAVDAVSDAQGRLSRGGVAAGRVPDRDHVERLRDGGARGRARRWPDRRDRADADAGAA